MKSSETTVLHHPYNIQRHQAVFQTYHHSHTNNTLVFGMQLTSIILAVTGAAMASAAAVESRIPRLGAFGVSQTFGCPLASQDFFEFALGAQSDACRAFYNNTTYAAINVYYWQPQCLLTLFTTLDCKDPVSTSSQAWFAVFLLANGR